MVSPDTSGVHLWLVMMKAHHAMSQHAEQSVARTGLCLSDFAVLEMLLHRGPLPIHSFMEKMMLTSGSLTAAVDRLEKKELVTREFCKTDRRVRIVHLTASGKALSEKLFAQHTEDMERATVGLNHAERKQLLGLLKKLGKSAEQVN